MTLYSVKHSGGNQSLIEAEDPDTAEAYAAELFGTMNGPYNASTDELNIALAQAFGAKVFTVPARFYDEDD